MPVLGFVIGVACVKHTGSIYGIIFLHPMFNSKWFISITDGQSVALLKCYCLKQIVVALWIRLDFDSSL